MKPERTQDMMWDMTSHPNQRKKRKINFTGGAGDEK